MAKPKSVGVPMLVTSAVPSAVVSVNVVVPLVAEMV